MKIFICGNINSGKSTLVNKLIQKYPNIPFLKIDDFRREYGDGTKEMEEYAISKFQESILNNENAFLEFVGNGIVADRVYEVISDNNNLIIKLVADLDLCLDRVEGKDFKTLPYPFKDKDINEQVKNRIRRNHQELTSGYIENLWSGKTLDVVSVNHDDDIVSIVSKYVDEIIKES